MVRTRVAVLRGGPSEEYSVSLKTGEAVLQAIDTDRFQPIDVVITRDGEWLLDGVVRYPENIIRIVDVAFLALHGAYGEDGTIQRFLDRFRVPYTGSKGFASSIAMNKSLTKQYLKETGIKMAPHITISRESVNNVPLIAERIIDTFGAQYFIKPNTSGSSVGVKIIKDSSMLTSAIRGALDLYNEIIVEPRIVGREATCGVVERYRNIPLYALPPIEIVPPETAEFFAANVKYSGETQEICPARFPRKIKEKIEHAAKVAHQTLGLSQYSRSDFIMTDDDVYFLEVNTLPGLTPQSLLPKALSAVGATYSSFITHLITDALHA